MAKQKYTPDFIPAGTIMEVVKYNRRNGGFVGTKKMSHGDFKSMAKQKDSRYQEFQVGFSQYKTKTK